MRNRLTSIGIIAFMLVALIIFALFFAVPKAALLTIPNRWNAIPLEQKKLLVHQFLGEPANSKNVFTEQWKAQRNSSEYVLTIFYDRDTVAASFELVFNYHLAFIQKQYHLKP